MIDKKAPSKMNVPLPPIDLEAPKQFETATFALG